MDKGNEFWGQLVGVLGLVIAVVAFLRDVFDWRPGKALNRQGIRRWARPALLVLIIVLVGYSLVSLNSRTQGLRDIIGARDQELSSAYATQAAWAKNAATLEFRLIERDKEAVSVIATRDSQATAIVVAETRAAAQDTTGERPQITPTIVASATLSPTAAPVKTKLPTPTRRLPILTVQVGESSVVQLTTGLGVNVVLDYDGVKTGDDVLDHLLAGYRNMGGEHFVSEIADGVYRIIPLRLFVRNYAGAQGSRQTLLTTGQEIEGHLVGTLSAPDGKVYDLQTAVEVNIVSLSEDDQAMEPSDTQSEDVWELEMSDPMDLAYHITYPRFAFQYGTPTGTGTVVEHETTTQGFELKIGEEEHPANLLDFDEIRFGKQETTVRTGDVESKGALFLRAGRSGFLTTDRHYRWVLVADLIDEEGAIAISNENKPVMTLRKVSR
jgi:hypothetical protein